MTRSILLLLAALCALATGTVVNKCNEGKWRPGARASGRGAHS